MSIVLISHVDFKKWPCSPVGFQGEESLRALVRAKTGTLVPLVYTRRGDHTIRAARLFVHCHIGTIGNNDNHAFIDHRESFLTHRSCRSTNVRVTKNTMQLI